MKKLTIFLLFPILLFPLSACNKGSTNTEISSTDNSALVQKPKNKQSEPQPIIVADTKLYLTKAYSNLEGPINIYREKITKTKESKALGKEITILQYPATKNLSYQVVLQDMQNALNSFGKENGKIVEQETENPPSLIFSVLQNNVYVYVKRIWVEPNTIKEIRFGLSVQPGTTFSEVDKKIFGQVAKMDNLPVYEIRPGQTAPDESESLSELKRALQGSYQPTIQQTQNGNITSFNTVDANQKLALTLIVSSTDNDVTPWLKEHIGEFDPIYLYAMAYRMAAIEKAPIQDMLFWSSLARLRASADRALCQDKHVGQYLTILAMDWTQPTYAIYDGDSAAQSILKDKPQIDNILRKAVAWDIKHSQKNSPAWFCNSGHGVRTSEAYPPKEWGKRRNEFKKEYTASLYK